MNIEEKIRKVMAEILGVGIDEIEEDSAIGDFVAWDSLNHLKIIATIEAMFDIQFSLDVLMDVEDFGDIVNAVKERVGNV